MASDLKKKVYFSQILFALASMVILVLMMLNTKYRSDQNFITTILDTAPHKIHNAIQVALNDLTNPISDELPQEKRIQINEIINKYKIYDYLVFNRQGKILFQEGTINLPENFNRKADSKNISFWQKLAEEIKNKGLSNNKLDYGYKVYLPFPLSGGTQWILVLKILNNNFQNLASQNDQFFLLKTILSSSLILLLAIISIFIIYSVFIKPTRTLHRTLQDLANGRINSRTYYYADDEFGKMAGLIDSIADQYERSVEQVSELKQQIRSGEKHQTAKGNINTQDSAIQTEDFKDDFTEQNIELENTNQADDSIIQEDEFDNLNIDLEEEIDLLDNPVDLDEDLSNEDTEKEKQDGIKFYQQKDFNGALKKFEIVMQNDPEDNESLLYYSDTLLHLDKNEAALQAYKKVLEEFPQDPDIHFKIGLLNYRLGHLNESAQEMEKAIELKTSYGDAWLYAGVSYANQGNYNDALKILSQAENQGIFKEEVTELIQKIKDMSSHTSV